MEKSVDGHLLKKLKVIKKTRPLQIQKRMRTCFGFSLQVLQECLKWLYIPIQVIHWVILQLPPGLVCEGAISIIIFRNRDGRNLPGAVCSHRLTWELPHLYISKVDGLGR